MNSCIQSQFQRGIAAALSALAVVVLTLSPLQAFAQGYKKKNPASKVYVTDVIGEAIIDTGEEIEDLAKRSVYTVQGSVIETKRPEAENDRSRYYSTMVYSNGTGAFFDADTRVEVKRFVQEPFTPNRNDIEVEPSISQTQAFLSRGAVGLCNSKLVAGSNMTYNTQLGSVNVRGRKVVIESLNDVTKVSMLEGESTVRAGPQDTGGHIVKVGEQALIRRGAPGQPNIIQIRAIPDDELPKLDDKVSMACMARKSVYFEVREKKADTLERTEAGARVGDSAAGAGAPNGTKAGGTAFAPVTVFDGGSSNTTGDVVLEIVPVEILAPTLPVEYTISNASIRTPTGR